MGVPARYDSVTLCPAGCGSRIHAGDMISYDPALGGFVHDECTPKPARPVVGVKCLVCGHQKPCRCDD